MLTEPFQASYGQRMQKDRRESCRKQHPLLLDAHDAEWDCRSGQNEWELSHLGQRSRDNSRRPGGHMQSEHDDKEDQTASENHGDH